MTVSMIQEAALSGQAKSAMSGLSENYDQFIKLLVAQVQNQDPLSPMDSTEFISQTAQLTQVEQSVRTNDQIETLLAELSVAGALSETALVGRDVTVAAEEVSLSEGTASFAYELSADATNVAALITDADGSVIRQISGLSGTGEVLHDVVWDGLDDNGSAVEDGTYAISLTSNSEDGAYNTFTSSEVTSVEYIGGAAALRLADGRTVSSNDLVRAS